MRPSRIIGGSLAVLLSGCAASQFGGSDLLFVPDIQISDVELFYQVYEAADGKPNATELQTGYIDAGTDGLQTFFRERRTTADRLALAIKENRLIYEDARKCVDVLPAAKIRIEHAIGLFANDYPDMRFPDLTVVVGRGGPVAIGSPVTGVQVGLEALCAINYLNPDPEDRFVHVLVHEYAHVQQDVGFVSAENRNVLEISLEEGAAEFIAELYSGNMAYGYFAEMTRGREFEIETAFDGDKFKTDLSDWLFNGTLTEPGDLGYWVGYRIVKSYYQNAADKRVALRDILQVTDAAEFLEASGWYPGVVLK